MTSSKKTSKTDESWNTSDFSTNVYLVFPFIINEFDARCPFFSKVSLESFRTPYPNCLTFKTGNLLGSEANFTLFLRVNWPGCQKLL